jgi:hypothetical protein
VHNKVSVQLLTCAHDFQESRQCQCASQTLEKQQANIADVDFKTVCNISANVSPCRLISTGLIISALFDLPAFAHKRKHAKSQGLNPVHNSAESRDGRELDDVRVCVCVCPVLNTVGEHTKGGVRPLHK